MVNGAWLRFKRKAAGLTLREMAERTGTSISHLADLEAGRHRAPAALHAAYASLRDRGLRDSALRRRRLAAGLTLAQVGRQLRVSVSALSDIERGRRLCPVPIAIGYRTLGRAALTRWLPPSPTEGPRRVTAAPPLQAASDRRRSMSPRPVRQGRHKTRLDR